MSDEADDVPIARPAALDYATLQGADAVPDFAPAAEAAIERGAPMAVVTRSFRRASIAADYVHRAIIRRHTPAEADEVCRSCGRSTSGVIVARWMFEVPGRPTENLLRPVRIKRRVNTSHVWCAECAQRLFALDRRYRRLLQVGIGIGSIGVAALVFGAWTSLGRRTIGESVIDASFGFIGLGVLLACVAGVYRWMSIPNAIGSTLPHWLAFRGWIEWFDRRSR